jgi:integrase
LIGCPEIDLRHRNPTRKLLSDAEPAKRAMKGEKMARRCFQRGSLFKRGKKRKMWVARWWEEDFHQDGVWRRRRRSEVLGAVTDLPTRREAELALSERLRRINRETRRPQGSLTFREFAQQRWIPDVFPSLKYSSKKHYEYVLNVHLVPAFGDRQLRLILREQVQDLLNAKLRGGLSWKTVKHIRTVLGTVLGAAEYWDIIESNPVRKTRLPRRGPIEDKVLPDPAQVQSLLRNLQEPSRTIATLLVLTGLRVGEALALRVKDIDFDQGLIRIRRTLYDGHFDEPKTRTSRRVIPIGPGASDLLRTQIGLKKDPDALVFCNESGGPLDRRNLLKRQLAPACTKLGLVGVTWHSLRHCNATLLDRVGAPLGTVQALLGHSSAEVTRGIYIHSLPQDARLAVEKVEEILIGPRRTQIVEIPKSVIQ